MITMKPMILSAVVMSVALSFAAEPKADDRAEVRVGNARFTVLTPRLIRMEWSEDGRFEDRATLTFVNRRAEVPEFKTTAVGDGVEIDTGAVKLRYLGGKFCAETLSADFDTAGCQGTWRFGDEDTDNLLGTRRTLDRVRGWETLFKNDRGEMEKGLVSRAGWTLLDDSVRQVLEPDGSKWGSWVNNRESGDRLDLYFFAYGHDYKAALGDYVRFAGPIPMPPKWAFGYWWSRYWQYSDTEFASLVKTLKSFDIPIDVLVVDMDWHRTWDWRIDGQRDETGSKIGWTGYSWVKELFPDPKGFFRWCRKEHLKTTLNLHPASGVRPDEDCYAAFAAEYGWQGTNAVPFAADEQKWCDAYFKTVLGPLERDGVDFWWLDWQQWLEAKGTPGLSNTFWLNHVFFRHAELRDGGKRRPMIYHRWGGLGSHRYQIGFSGDTYINWETLGALPYFTATAANVGYGYWGHDIGGHFDDEGTGRDPEIYLRWLQIGAFMPVFKTHPAKNNVIERRIWKYPDHFELMREAFYLRYRLVPYLYSAARTAYETGVSVCRPLYYDWPEESAAYETRLPEMMVGEDIVAVAVASPADVTTGLSRVEFWLPPGKWYDAARGRLLDGGRHAEEYALCENPRFVRAGAIIPQFPSDVRNVQSFDGRRMVLEFIPGDSEGVTTLYEDDGVSQGYERNFAKTKVEWQDELRRISVHISPREGAYRGAPARRAWELRFPSRFAPISVKGGKWRYDAAELAVVVEVAPVSASEPVDVELCFGEEAADGFAAFDGVKGSIVRAREIVAEFKEMFNLHISRGAAIPAPLLTICGTEGMIAAKSERIGEVLAKRRAAIVSFKEEMAILAEKFPAEFTAKVRAQLELP